MQAIINLFVSNPIMLVMPALLIILLITSIASIIIRRKLKKGLFALIAGIFTKKILKKDKKDEKDKEDKE